MFFLRCYNKLKKIYSFQNPKKIQANFHIITQLTRLYSQVQLVQLKLKSIGHFHCNKYRQLIKISITFFGTQETLTNCVKQEIVRVILFQLKNTKPGNKNDMRSNECVYMSCFTQNPSYKKRRFRKSCLMKSGI